MGGRVACVISRLYHILIYLCQILIGLLFFTPVVALFNIGLYQPTWIAQCPDFVTISWIDLPKIIALSFLKSSVLFAFFMDFLDKSNKISLATMCAFNITLLFPNIIGMFTFCNAGKSFPLPNLFVLLTGRYWTFCFSFSFKLDMWQLNHDSPATVLVGPQSGTVAFHDSQTSVFICSGWSKSD